MATARNPDPAAPAEEDDSFEQPDIHLCEIVREALVDETKAEWAGFMERMSAVR